MSFRKPLPLTLTAKAEEDIEDILLFSTPA